MRVTRFINTVQRRSITMDSELLDKVEPFFAIETHMSAEERVLLMKVAFSLPENFIACEVGSYLGASTSFLALAASMKNGHVHCVDTWDNRAMDVEAPRDTYGEFCSNTEKFSEFISPHRGESSALAETVPSGLDLLFMDGDHSYEATRDDLRLYGDKLKLRGLLLLHDFGWDTVQRACMEYLATRPAVAFCNAQNLQGFRMSS